MEEDFLDPYPEGWHAQRMGDPPSLQPKGDPMEPHSGVGAEEDTKPFDYVDGDHLLKDEDHPDLHVVRPRSKAYDYLSEEHRRTHCPFDPRCPACNSANSRRIACKRYRQEDGPRRGAKRFGDIVSFDLISPHRGKKDQEIVAADGSHTAILFYVLATGWLQIVPLARHDKDAIVRAIRFFAGN